MAFRPSELKFIFGSGEPFLSTPPICSHEYSLVYNSCPTSVQSLQSVEPPLAWSLIGSSLGLKWSVLLEPSERCPGWQHYLTKEMRTKGKGQVFGLKGHSRGHMKQPRGSLGVSSNGSYSSVIKQGQLQREVSMSL